MKKVIFWLLLISWLLTVGQFESYSYSAQSEKLIKAFNNQMSSMTEQKKKDYLNIITSILNEPKVQRNANSTAKILIKELWERSASELNKLKKTKTTSNIAKKSDWTNYQTLPNVDFDKVRSTLLSWHNDLRIEKWIEKLEYHSDLEKSAVAWAKEIAENWLTQWVHKRTESDWFYNYNNIKDWFNNLNVFFPSETQWKAVFSESVWYRYYKCNNWDCTDKLIESAKKVFDSFIKEWEKGTHYKAIVMPHFSRIWIWFWLNPSTNMVYVVFHYAEEVVE